MECHNHAGVAAAGNCTGCAEAFCAHCLVTIKGAPYCASCKTMAVAPGAMAIQVPCKEASDALKYALIGTFCFGIILEPIAISKALAARKRMSEDPTLTGRGKATAALICAAVVLVLWIVGIMSRAMAP